MSVTDPVVLVLAPEYDKPWSFMRGKETFYDEENIHRRWHTWQEAAEWCEANLGVSPIEHLPEGARERAREDMAKSQQRRLL